jgi:hypothetical protein
VRPLYNRFKLDLVEIVELDPETDATLLLDSGNLGDVYSDGIILSDSLADVNAIHGEGSSFRPGMSEEGFSVFHSGFKAATLADAEGSVSFVVIPSVWFTQILEKGVVAALQIENEGPIFKKSELEADSWDVHAHTPA